MNKLFLYHNNFYPSAVSTFPQRSFHRIFLKSGFYLKYLKVRHKKTERNYDFIFLKHSHFLKTKALFTVIKMSFVVEVFIYIHLHYKNNASAHNTHITFPATLWLIENKMKYNYTVQFCIL